MPPLRTTTFVAKPVSVIAEARPVDPFFILGCVFVAASILCSIAAYGYGWYLNRQTVVLDQKVQLISESLKQYPLEDMLLFNTRITLVQRLLNNHTFPSTILAALSNGVEKNVYYNTFGLSYQPGIGHTLTLSAIAPDYASVARQMDTLKNKTAYGALFKSVEMVSLGKDQYGNKLFNINISVVGNLRENQINFGNQAKSNNSQDLPTIVAAPAVEAPVVATSTATTTGSTASSSTSNNSPTSL